MSDTGTNLEYRAVLSGQLRRVLVEPVVIKVFAGGGHLVTYH